MLCPVAYHQPVGPPSALARTCRVRRSSDVSLLRPSGRRRRQLKASSSAPSRGKVQTSSCTSEISLWVASVRPLAVSGHREPRLAGARRAARGVLARTKERQGLKARESSRERRELVVGDVQRRHVPVLCKSRADDVQVEQGHISQQGECCGGREERTGRIHIQRGLTQRLS